MGTVEITQTALASMTNNQLHSLRPLLTNWRASKINVYFDFNVHPGSLHYDPNYAHLEQGFLLVYIHDENNKLIYTLGIAPNGDMHS